MTDEEMQALAEQLIGPLTNRARRGIQNRALAGRDPDPLEQVLLDAARARQEKSGEQMAKEVVGGAIDAAVPLPLQAVRMVMEPTPAQGGAASSQPATDDQLQAEAAANMDRRAAEPTVWEQIKGAVMPEAAAQTKLTKAQQREQERLRLEQDRALQAERERAQISSDTEKARKIGEIEAEKQRYAAQLAMKEQEAAAQAAQGAKPIRQQHPWAGPASVAAGYAAALLAPALIKGAGNWMTYGRRSVPSRMDTAISGAQDVLSRTGNLSAADKAMKGVYADELAGLVASANKGKTWQAVNNNLALPVAGGFLAAEARMIPDRIDVANPRLSKEDREKAETNLADKKQLLIDALLGGMTGWSAQKVAGGLVPRKAPNVERADALRNALMKGRQP